MILAAKPTGDVVVRTAESLNTGLDLFILSLLLTLMAAVSVAIISNRNMFGVVILAGIYSFLMASVMMTLDAVDVAMTEAAVGAGISSIIFLATLHLTGSMEYPQPRSVGLPLFVAIVVGGALVFGTYGLPPFGAADTPMHTHTAPRFIEMSKDYLMPPNMVTAVLADFRAFDTLGEAVVVFTGGMAVLMLLRGKRKRLQGQPEDVGFDARSPVPPNAKADTTGEAS
ncbi:MAG: DUF4040 domain-containing protein [Pseudomonadota bacterium]